MIVMVVVASIITVMVPAVLRVGIVAGSIVNYAIEFSSV
jgi:hypothetical protein